jgi:threonine/homoserine/homoserine lactone efflux protein
MVSSTYLIRFVMASAAIILVPGPSIMFVIARAIAWGRATAFLTVLGNALGMLALSFIVAVGLGPLLQNSDVLLAALQLAGGSYLIYLGLEAIKNRTAQATNIADVNEIKPTAFKNIRQGFMVGLLNPKAIVFIGAIFPQFLDPNGSAMWIQLLLFGFIWSTLAILGDGMWATVVGSSRDWFVKSHSRLVALRSTGGIVMIILGLGVLIPELLRISSN